MSFQSEIDLERLIGEGGNASLPEIDLEKEPELKQVFLSKESVSMIQTALQICLDHNTNNMYLTQKLNKALTELKT